MNIKQTTYDSIDTRDYYHFYYHDNNSLHSIIQPSTPPEGHFILLLSLDSSHFLTLVITVSLPW